MAGMAREEERGGEEGGEQFGKEIYEGSWRISRDRLSLIRLVTQSVRTAVKKECVAAFLSFPLAVEP
eukprot:750461-Hanusia_phi.AAC.5